MTLMDFKTGFPIQRYSYSENKLYVFSKSNSGCNQNIGSINNYLEVRRLVFYIKLVTSSGRSPGWQIARQKVL